MTGAAVALGALCAVLGLLLAGCYAAVRALRSRAEAAERRATVANDARLSAESKVESLGRRVAEWAKVAAENEARAQVMAAKAAEVAGERDRARLEAQTLAAKLADRDQRWIGAIREARSRAHPSGQVARVLDGVARKVRGEA